MQKTDRAPARKTLSICSLALALAVAAGACGQRGPLYLPDSAPAGDTAADDAAEQDERSPEVQDPESDKNNEETP